MNYRQMIAELLGLAAFGLAVGCDQMRHRVTTDVDGYYMVNLRPYMTAGFSTDKNAKGIPNDLRCFKPGVQKLQGITFDIVDEHANDGKAQIELGSSKHFSEELPRQVMNIPLGGRTAKTLYLIQKSAWSEPGRVGEYRIHYADGTVEKIPLVIGENLADWWGPHELPKAKVGWKGNNGLADVGVYLYTWDNPHPEKALTALDFVSDDTGPLLSLFAITAEKP